MTIYMITNKSGETIFPPYATLESAMAAIFVKVENAYPKYKSSDFTVRALEV